MQEDDENQPIILDSVTGSPVLEVNNTEKTHKLTTIQLIIFTYFWTVGGPFGIER
jgi:hypothetical protein